FALISLFVLFARNAVLRVREFYADARALQWSGSTEPLDRALALDQGSQLRMWRRLLALHPTAAIRRAELRAPQRLFHLRFVDAAAAGVAAGVAFRVLTVDAQYLLPKPAVME